MGFRPINNGGSGASVRIEVLVSGSPFDDVAALETWSQANESELYNELVPAVEGDALRVATAVVDGLNYKWEGPNQTYAADSWVSTSALTPQEKNAIDSIISLDAGVVPIGQSNKLVPSIQSQDGEKGMNFDGEITTTKGTVNIGRGLSLGESGLAPIFKDVLENESSIPVVTPVHSDGTTDTPCYIRRYDSTDQVLQPLEDETNLGKWEAGIPVTFTRILTKLRIKFGAAATGVRLTIRFANSQTDKTNTILYQSHTDAEFNAGGGFSVSTGLFEFVLGTEDAKVIKDKFVYVVLEQNTQGTGEIQLLGSTIDIGGITQFYAYLEQTYVLEEKVKLENKGVNWKKIENNYDSVEGDMFLDVRPTLADITVKIDDTYPDDWSGLFVYNESKRKNVFVRTQSNDLVSIVERGEGRAIYLADGDFQATTIMGKPNGTTEVVEFDVSESNTRTVDNTFVGKLISITQSNTSQNTPMQITLEAHDTFETGDIITVSESNEYVSRYFAVYYSDSQGRQQASFPSNNIRMVRTDSGWDVSLDGRFQNVILTNKTQTAFSGNPITEDAHTVSGYVFVHRPGVDIVTDDSGKELLRVDIGQGGSAESKIEIFDSDKTISSASELNTFVFRQPNLASNAVFNINLNVATLSEDWRITLANDARSRSTLELKINNVLRFIVIPGVTFDLFKNESQNDIDFIQTSGIFNKILDQDYLNDATADWESLVQGNYVTVYGTISSSSGWPQILHQTNVTLSVDIENTSDLPQVENQYIRQEYAVVRCSDENLIGLRFSRFAEDPSKFTNTPFDIHGSNLVGYETINGVGFSGTLNKDGQFPKVNLISTSPTQAHINIGDQQGTPYLQSDEHAYLTTPNGTKRLITEEDIEGEVKYHEIIAGGELDAGTYNLYTAQDKASEHDLFYYNWANNQESYVVPLVVVKTKGNYTLDSRWTLRYNPAGDNYQLLTTGKVSALGSVGYTTGSTLSSSDSPAPIESTIVTPDNPLEVQAPDDTIHDFLSVTEAGKMVVGTASSKFTELQFATDQPRISVNAKINGQQEFKLLAYTTDAYNPSEGFTLDDNAIIRFVDTAKMLLDFDQGTHNVLNFPYDGQLSYYFMQLGDVNMHAEIKTLKRPIISEKAGGFWTVAYDEENHIPHTVWERSTQPRAMTEEELYLNVDYIFEPFGDGHIAHLVIPARTVWQDNFWIAGVNDEKEGLKPDIRTFRMSMTIPRDKIGTTEKHKLRLTSADNLTNFDQDGTDVITGVHGKTWEAFWARPEESSPQGWAGWVLKFSPDDEDDFVPYSTYESQGVAYTGIPSNSLTRVIDGVGYVEIDRQAPVETTDASTDGFVLIQINAAETETTLPTVRKVAPGTLASGFSFCDDGTTSGTQILQIASGTYTLSEMPFAVPAAVGDGVYVDETGKLSLTVSDYQAGWVITGGVVIDIDIYNRNLNNTTSDTFDVLTTRVLKVHEGPSNPDKFTQWAIDGNFNTDIHAVGDTHYYAKDKDNGNLTEAYQVYEDGDVEFKQAVRVNDGVNDSDAVNVSQLDTVNARVDSMLEMLVQQEAHIHSLEESNGESFGDFEIYSANPNEVRVDMIKLNGTVESKTVVLGNTPPPDPPTPPSGAFPVYFGWDINSRALIQASDIINYQSTDERGADLTITDSTMLTTTYTLTRSDISEWKYMYIAYPKDVVDPNPYKVEYSGFVADWLVREVVISSHTYVVLITELPNKADSFSIKLHE